MKFAMFFMAEYANMITVACLATVLFLGGWHGPLFGPHWLQQILPLFWFFLRVFFFLFLYIWIRGTLPRFRYDQLMSFGCMFVFVIMLLNAGEEERTEGSRIATIIGIPAMLVGSGLIFWILLARSNTQAVPAGALPGPPRTIAWLLFHDFLLPFEVTSVLVLIAIMGAVVLASPPESVQQSKKEV